MKKLTIFLLIIGHLISSATVHADLRLNSVFSDNMVIQRSKAVKIWGWAEAGEKITVSFDGQTQSAKTDQAGKWSVSLASMKANSINQSLTIKGESKTIELKNILIGDVWVAGGQSNMEHELSSIYHGDVEAASADYPNIRLIKIPQLHLPKPQDDFIPLNEYSGWSNRYQEKGYWNICSPEVVPRFSGIAYVFARRLHMVSKVPIGMVDMSVGGTTVENWTSTESLKAVDGTDAIFAAATEKAAERKKNFNPQKDLENRIKSWARESDLRKRLKLSEIPKPTQLRSEPDLDRATPSSWYNAMTISWQGFAVKGIIFNQGHNNAGGDCRPKLYAKMFKAMIADWRANFDDPNLPFGIVAFVSGGQPQTRDNFELRMLDSAPWIREAQHKAYLELPNIGYTASYDQQTGFYHPFSKVLLGERIARWALHTQYDQKQIGHAAIKIIDVKQEGNQYIVTFDGPSGTMYESKRPIEGFAIAGKDKHFYPAQAKIFVTGKDKHNRDQIDRKRMVVWCDLVEEPVALRYAWARNPMGNVGNWKHMERMIPLPCFRTDDWEMPWGPECEALKGDLYKSKGRQMFHELRKNAEKQIKKRKIEEAKLVLETLDQK